MCAATIHEDEIYVVILRNVECRESSDKMIRTDDSVVLATLCASCGSRYPQGNIKVLFGNQSA